MKKTTVLDKIINMFTWDNNTIEYLENAEHYSNSAAFLIKNILPYIYNKNNALEIACGLGNVSIKLSKIFKKVTAIDISKEVIENLDKKIRNKQISNIKCYIKSAKEKFVEKYDLIFSSLYYDKDVLINLINNNLNESGVIINIFRLKLDKQITKNMKNSHDALYENYEKELNANNINYEKRIINIPRHQPLKDEDDIFLFLSHIDNKFKDMLKSEKKSYVDNLFNEQIINRINVPNNNTNYKYLYNITRESVMYIIKK